MSRHVAHGLAVALAALLGCSEERTGSDPTGDTSSSAGGLGGGGGGSSGSVGGAGGEGGGAVGPACEACWADACDPEVDACLAEDACSCRVACDEELSCVAACPASAPFETLLRCVAEASVGTCAALCDTTCERCAFAGCAPEADACFDDPRCVCGIWCEDDPACESTCGESPASQPLRDCVGEQGAACADECG